MANKIIKLKDVKVPLDLKVKFKTQDEAKKELLILLERAEKELDKHKN